MFLYVAILNTVLAFSGRSPAMAVETYSDDLCVKLYRYRRSLDLLVVRRAFIYPCFTRYLFIGAKPCKLFQKR